MAHLYYFTPDGGTTAQIIGADSRHLTQVLRTRPGEHLPLCDGQGFCYEGLVLSAQADEVCCRLEGKTPSTAEPTLRVLCCIAFAKGDKMDWAVQKSVEAGADSFLLFPGEKSVSQPQKTSGKLERLRRVAHEAAKQSGRGVLPTLAAAPHFSAMLQMALAFSGTPGNVFLFSPGAVLGLKAVLAQRESDKLVFVTGPESGFSEAECKLAEKAGVLQASLGSRILRCETAPVVALAAALALSEG